MYTARLVRLQDSKETEEPFFSACEGGEAPFFQPKSFDAAQQVSAADGGQGTSFAIQPDSAHEKIKTVPSNTVAQRQEEEEEETLQPKLESPKRAQTEAFFRQTKPVFRKAEGDVSVVSRELSSQLNRNKGKGRPLPESTHAFMSNAFGADFSDVKVHTGNEAVKMNKALGAKAFTHGTDIYFNRGAYRPDASTGKQLLAHELTHVVQQRNEPAETMTMGADAPIIQRFGAGPHAQIEESILSGTMPESEIREITFGSWQTDMNQISLLKPILNKVVIVTDEDLFEIVQVLAEAKFDHPGSRAVSGGMSQSRFGNYDPRQHYDNPSAPGQLLEEAAIPAYITNTTDYLKAVLRTALYFGRNRAGREYYGRGLHILQDFFAHSNFVEIAINLRTQENREETFAGTVKEGQEERYRLATGIFETIDTTISLLKLLINHLKKKSPPGQILSTSDKILIILLRRKYPELADNYLRFKTGMHMLKESIPIPFVVEQLLQTIERIKQVLLVFLTQKLNELTKNLAKHSGTGPQPSHSKLNKDDQSMPLFSVAAALAKEAVGGVHKAMLTAWTRSTEYRRLHNSWIAREYGISPSSEDADLSSASGVDIESAMASGPLFPTAPSDLSALREIEAEVLTQVDIYTQHPDEASWWHTIVNRFI